MNKIRHNFSEFYLLPLCLAFGSALPLGALGQAIISADNPAGIK
jgi:hypothetical protein